MNLENKIKHKTHTEDMIDLCKWKNPFAVTLTCKTRLPNGHAGTNAIDMLVANENLRHFQNYLNRKLIKLSAHKRGERIKFVAVTEQGSFGRIHHHLIIECPDLEKQIETIIRQCWMKTQWGYNEIVLKPCDSGWVDYILKFKTKENYDEYINYQLWHC